MHNMSSYFEYKASIGIMKGEIYGGPKYLRMNIGCPQSKLKEGLRRFKIAMDALYSK